MKYHVPTKIDVMRKCSAMWLQLKGVTLSKIKVKRRKNIRKYHSSVQCKEMKYGVG